MNVKLFATFRDIINSKEVDIPVPESLTVKQLIQGLIKQFPAFESELFNENDELKPFTHIFVNGRNIIHLDGLNTKITKSDDIALIPPVGGG